jgi:tetratricopeptide (TPR) repeat protein
MRKFIPNIRHLDNTLEDQIRLGITLLKQHRADEALEKFEGILESTPELTMIRLQVSQILLTRKQYQRALESFRKTLADDPFTPKALLAVAQILLKAGHIDAAGEYFQSLLAMDPLAEWGHIGAVEVFLKNNQIDEAIDQCHLAIKKNPKIALHYLQLAIVQLRQKDRAGAVSSLHQAINLDPGFAQAHAYLAEIQTEEGDLNAALASFYRALDGNPLLFKLHPQIQLVFIKTLVSQNHLEDIEVLLSELPDYQDLAFLQCKLRGDYYMKAKAYNQAVDSYRGALMLRSIQKGVFPSHLGQFIDVVGEDLMSVATTYQLELDSQGELPNDATTQSLTNWLR